MNRPVIYCISDGTADPSDIEGSASKLVYFLKDAAACGITHFQIREKHLPARDLVKLARGAAEAARGAGIKLLVNGRTDIALAAGADGVHLPSDGIPPEAVRKMVPDGFLIGVSTHVLRVMLEVKNGGADYVFFGPVYESPGKGDGVGPSRLAEVCRAAAGFPVVALGGVDAGTAEEVLAAGAVGYAAIRYLNECVAAGTMAAGAKRNIS